MKHLLECYSGRGLTLQQISGPRIIGRSVAVLKKYCRQFNIAFADYTPRAMRKRKGEGD